MVIVDLESSSINIGSDSACGSECTRFIRPRAVTVGGNDSRLLGIFKNKTRGISNKTNELKQPSIHLKHDEERALFSPLLAVRSKVMHSGLYNFLLCTCVCASVCAQNNAHNIQARTLTSAQNAPGHPKITNCLKIIIILVATPTHVYT